MTWLWRVWFYLRRDFGQAAAAQHSSPCCLPTLCVLLLFCFLAFCTFTFFLLFLCLLHFYFLPLHLEAFGTTNILHLLDTFFSGSFCAHWLTIFIFPLPLYLTYTPPPLLYFLIHFKDTEGFLSFLFICMDCVPCVFVGRDSI